MDLNLHATRSLESEACAGPKTVVWQYDVDDPMNPCSLLVAYAEEKVLPVASDFDAFIVGSRGIAYDTLSEDQVETLKWCVGEVEGILDAPRVHGWTRRWLDVLKGAAKKGYHPVMPPFGYGDPVSYAMQAHCIDRLGLSGAVRHGAESFNYFFPQDLDEQVLVMWDGFEKRKAWKYMGQSDLRAFLLDRAKDGFAFPVNPKWILCDHSEWMDIFKALESNADPSVRAAIDAWFPPSSGLRERLRAIRSSHPTGFQPERDQLGHDEAAAAVAADKGLCCDMAHLHYRRYLTMKRAKLKLHAAFVWMKQANLMKRFVSGLKEAEALRETLQRSGGGGEQKNARRDDGGEDGGQNGKELGSTSIDGTGEAPAGVQQGEVCSSLAPSV